jgi:hypothetical protein
MRLLSRCCLSGCKPDRWLAGANSAGEENTEPAFPWFLNDLETLICFRDLWTSLFSPYLNLDFYPERIQIAPEL